MNLIHIIIEQLRFSYERINLQRRRPNIIGQEFIMEPITQKMYEMNLLFNKEAMNPKAFKCWKIMTSRSPFLSLKKYRSAKLEFQKLRQENKIFKD
jgi:hypothetical protein